jgi:hypothetical protein
MYPVFVSLHFHHHISFQYYLPLKVNTSDISVPSNTLKESAQAQDNLKPLIADK